MIIKPINALTTFAGTHTRGAASPFCPTCLRPLLKSQVLNRQMQTKLTNQKLGSALNITWGVFCIVFCCLFYLVQIGQLTKTLFNGFIYLSCSLICLIHLLTAVFFGEVATRGSVLSKRDHPFFFAVFMALVFTAMLMFGVMALNIYIYVL